MASAASERRGSPSAGVAARARIDSREANPRRTMSWRRGSPTAGVVSKDPRQRTGSMVDDRELLRRKALVLGAGSSATAAAADGGEDELVMLHFQDVREELELSGHNLTSVLNNPRETLMDSLYEAAFDAEPPLPDLEVVRANVPHGMREVTPQVCVLFLHHPCAARVVLFQSSRNQPMHELPLTTKRVASFVCTTAVAR